MVADRRGTLAAPLNSRFCRHKGVSQYENSSHDEENDQDREAFEAPCNAAAIREWGQIDCCWY